VDVSPRALVVLFETDGDLVAELGRLEEQIGWGDEPFDEGTEEQSRAAAEAVADLSSVVRRHEAGELPMLRPIDPQGTELCPLIFTQFASFSQRDLICHAARLAGDAGLAALLELGWDDNRSVLSGLDRSRPYRLLPTEEVAYRVVALEMLRALRGGPLERFAVFGPSTWPPRPGP
jgi:hypothetical protein